ncbi:MAG: DUF5012 domain-containing protein [Paludibacteraceae bacterium]|nr:DUF5012 domain-containing protein [Paludibacteraceae bacterium]
MKKNILFIATLALLALGFTSCEKESAGLTKITYYAEIALEGESTMIVAKGSEFVDPGFTATMKGEDVSDQVEVSSDVDTSESGVYSIIYSIVNEDGFTASASRTVIVLDLGNPIEGFWACSPASYRTNNNSGAVGEYGASYEILIIGNGDGTYFVDDLLAGWYAQKAGYGSDYAMQAEIAIDDVTGAITLNDSYVPGWSDAADALSSDAKYDAATQTISYTVTYAGYMDFTVELTKVDLGL